MKTKLSHLCIILISPVFCLSQNLDSVRQVIQSLEFNVPILPPLPSEVTGTEVPGLSLNGTWEFYTGNSDSDQPRHIEVPGEWEMQGFKVPKGNPATYRKLFVLPADWKGKQIWIRFDGVSSFGRVRINDREIGSHEGSFATFGFDITDAVKPGKNTVEVEVQCETVSDILACTSQYAAHPVGGILRKVTVFALPPVYISDFSCDVTFNASFRDAVLHVQSTISATMPIGQGTLLKFHLTDMHGKSVSLGKNTFEIPEGSHHRRTACNIAVKSPATWDPEHPILYELQTSVVQNGKVLQTNRQKIGFRQIELRGNQLFINNHPVKLRGVDRHEVHPLRGRSLTPELCRRDVELFREGNCNFIRTSHYPPFEEFLQACDELGMFVESEASLCWIQHGASPVWKEWNYLDTKFLPFMLRANYDNVLAGRQHPCVILWSLGNESRWSPLWERVNAEIKKLDPSRPTVFHDQCWTSFNNAGSRADVANYHYPNFNGPGECEKEKNRPTLFGEYMHVQCYARRELETDPSVRSDVWATTLKRMVDSVYRYPACLGGAIWSGIDDIFHLSSDRICGYGPWGPIDGWRREKPEYTGMKKSYAPVIVANLHSLRKENGSIILEIENRFNFTNLADIKAEVKAGDQIIRLNTTIPPLSSGTLAIDLSEISGHEALKIIFYDPRGFVCQEELIELNQQPERYLPAGKVEPIFSDGVSKYTIVSGNLLFTVSKADGILECIRSGGEQVFTSGCRLMLIPFNNDDGGAPHIAGNNYTQDIKPLDYEPVEDLTVHSVECRKDPAGSVIVSITAEVKSKLEGNQVYVFGTDGRVTISYQYKLLTDFAKKNLLRQFGLLFTLPEAYDLLAWKRKGLWTAYPEYDINRLNGTARALPRNLNLVEVPREVPTGLWKDNSNRLGTNDFKSTKDHILRASLKNSGGSELYVQSDGSQSARAWVDGDQIRFLVAGLNGPGSCNFFTGPRPEFFKGDLLTGKFELGIR